MSDDKPAFLFWTDLETTGLDPEKCVILEMAFILTQFDYPYQEIVSGAFLFKQGTGWLDQMDDFVRTMHTKSGLLADLASEERVTIKALRTYQVEEQLIGFAVDWPPPANDDKTVLSLRADLALELHEAKKMLIQQAVSEARARATDRRVVMAGNSVHFDKSFLKQHMPLFNKRFSHRLFDVSAVSLACRSMGMPRLPKPDDAKAHRAGYDVHQSLEQARACVAWLKSLDAIAPIKKNS